MNDALEHASRPDDVELVAKLAHGRGQIVEQLRKRIVGQDAVIDLLLLALFARGHGL
jgi:MoxR-like ATPase